MKTRYKISAIILLAIFFFVNIISKFTIKAKAFDNSLITQFYYTGSVQTYTAPQTGYYIIEAYGASGGSAHHGVSWNIRTTYGGKGGLVSGKVYLTQGQTLYINVGGGGVNSEQNVGVPGGFNGGGSTSSGGSASGGGATDIRLSNNNINSRIMVAGGGGGASRYVSGNDGGIASSGNNGTLFYGSNGGHGYSGGGGGYYGGTSGSSGTSSNGGSNYIDTSKISVIQNKGGMQSGNGFVQIERMTNYRLTVKLDGGFINGNPNDLSYSFTGSSAYQQFYYTGKTQKFVADATGFYKLSVYGASGGGNSGGGSRGGYGGYAEGMIYLEEGQALYVNVGGKGYEGYESAGGWNGGGNSDKYGSGSSGGGATDISLYGQEGSTNWNTTEHLYSRIIVAGGGGGSDNTELGSNGSGDDGSGGSGGGTNGGYATNDGHTETRWAPGTQTSGYAFGRGQSTAIGGVYQADGGGGGGGWYGGYAAGGTLDYYCGNQAGGAGGSGYVYTQSTAQYYPSGCLLNSKFYLTETVMKNGVRWGEGYAIIQGCPYQKLYTPTKEGYTFTGYKVLSGNGTVDNNLMQFTYAENDTVIIATYKKNEGYGQLTINPNGGIYNETISGIGQTKDNIIYRRYSGNKIPVTAPSKYGYIFTGWTFSGGGTWDGSTYTYGWETTATLTANYKIATSTLTIDPNGGLYKGSSEKISYKNKNFGTKVKIEVPTRTGYEFIEGWDEILSSDGYIENDNFVFATKDAYLKAVWTANTYTVVYNKNKPSISTSNVTGSQNNNYCTYDQSFNLNTNSKYANGTGFSLVGWHFVGWNTKADGTGTMYSSGQNVINLTTVNKGTVTLYAIWKPNTYYISYNRGLSDTTITMPTATHLYDNSVTTPKNIFLGRSYVLSFDHNIPKKYDGTNTLSNLVNKQENTLQGNLEFLHFNIVASNNSGNYKDATNIGIKNFEFTEYNTSIASAVYKEKVLTFNNPSLTGYTFNGWYLEDKTRLENVNEKTSTVTVKPNTKPYTHVATASWTAHTYKVIYKNYDGHGNDYTQNCTYDKLYNYLNNPSDLSDSIFLGWYAKENPSSLTDGVISGGTSFTNLTSVDNGVIYVYGKWSKTNLTEDATNKNPVFIKTDQIKIDGSNVYKDPTRDKTYFIKNNTLFNLSFNGMIDSNTNIKFLPMITNVDTFTVGKLETSINNNDFVFNENLSVSPINTIKLLEYKDSFSAIRKDNSTPNTNKTLLSYKQGYMVSNTKDGQLIEIVPHSSSTLIRTKNGKDYTTTYNTKDSDDKNHNIFVECDSTKPTITNNSVYDLGNSDYNPLISTKTDIVIKYSDFVSALNVANPKYGSGVDTKNIKLTITQEQNDDGSPSISKVYTDSSVQDFLEIKANDLYSGTVTLHIDPAKYSDMSGFINFKLEITDNVGNTATKEYRILVLDFDAKVLNAAPGNRQNTNKFAQGENGKIEIETNGFADKIDFKFPSTLDNLAQNEKSNAGDIENPIWQEGRVLSDTYPRDKDGNVIAVLPEMQTKLWGTENIGGMQWNENNYEHCSLIHYFYAPLYSQNGKYQVLVTIYKTDPLYPDKIYTVQKTYDFYIGQNSDDPLDIIAPITEEFRDTISDN